MALAALLKRFWPVLVVLAAIVAFFIWQDNVKDTAKEEGAAAERSATNEGVLNNVQASTAAVTSMVNPVTGNCIKYAQCVRSSRTPENCKRFLPAGQTVNGEPGTCPESP